MIYHLFQYLNSHFDIAGARLIQYSTFRAAIVFILSFIIATLIGKKIIARLYKRQITDQIRDLGLPGENTKKNTPSMGGIIMIIAILIPILLFARLDNVYIWLIIFSIVLMGGI